MIVVVIFVLALGIFAWKRFGKHRPRRDVTFMTQAPPVRPGHRGRRNTL